MLTNLKTIFVPTDFSQNANQSLPFAAELAVQTGASLTLLYCAEEPFDFAPMVDNKKEKVIDKVTELFESIINNLKSEKKFKKLIIDYKLLSGHPVVNILEEAKAHEAGLIVMGTKGATSSRKLLFGSITTEIILNSDVPVLAIPQDSSFRHFKEIVFTTDFHEGDLSSLSQIVELGKLFNSNIRVLHVAEEKSLATEIKFRGFRDLVREQFPEAPITFQMLMEDDFFVGVAEFLTEHPTHLLVMTRYKKNFWQKMLTRNHSKEMGFYTDVPLLTLVGDSVPPFEIPSTSKRKVQKKQPTL